MTQLPDANIQGSTLLRLPQEVLVQVANYLSPYEVSQPEDDAAFDKFDPLLRLRSTCKEMQIRAKDITTEMYFFTRQCNISDRQDLETLLSVSRHKVFSKAVKQVTFSFPKIRDIMQRFPGYRYRCIYCHGQGRRRKGCMNAPDEKSCDHSRYRMNYALHHPKTSEAFRRLLDSQNEFLGRGGDSGFLHMILSNFKMTNNIPAITAGIDDARDIELDEGEVPKALKRGGEQITMAFADSGYRFDLDSADTDYHPFEIISEAIRNTDYPITSLTLGCEDIAVPLSTEEFIFRNLTLASLKDLTICLKPPDASVLDRLRPDVLDRDIQDSAPPFVDFLRQSPNLETLDLSLPQGWVSDEELSLFFAAIANEVATGDPKVRALRNIRDLRLRNYLEVSERDLVAFVRASRTTLTCLHVDEPWSDKQSDIASRTPLAAAVLEVAGMQGREMSGDALVPVLVP